MLADYPLINQHTAGLVAQAEGREGDISFSGFSAGALLPGSTYSALWGALENVGRLGGLDIFLPVEVAARISAAPGLACLPCPVPRQQLNCDDGAPDQVAAAANNDHDGAASSRLCPAETSNKKSKQAAYKSRAAAQQGDGATESADAESGQIILSLEEAFFLAYALGALTVSQTSTDTSSSSALTCEVLPNTKHPTR